MEKELPSLSLAYEQVKDVLVEQEQTAERIDGKIATLFAAATGVFGISIPFFFNILDVGKILKIDDFTSLILIALILSILVVFSILTYIAIVRLSLKAYRLTEFITMNHPTEIRQNLWQFSPSEFMYEVLINTEKAFYKNDAKLKEKARQSEALFDWIRIELLTIGGLIFIVFALH